MVKLNSADDWHDDGGTRAWRNNHRVIDVEPDRRGTFSVRRPRPTFAQWAMVIIFIGGILPFIIIFGGVLCLAIFDSIHRAITG